MGKKREMTRADILPMELFERGRPERRAAIGKLKRNRRVEVGPFAAFYFENYDTVWWQVHEMLRVERGGEAQIEGELSAYNPLIPRGRELVATLMFEIDDQVRRARELSRLGGVENAVSLSIDGEVIDALPLDEVERSTPEGRTSAVHFLRFPFKDEQVAAFRDASKTVVLRVSHPYYGHMAVMPAAVRQALSEDFD